MVGMWFLLPGSVVGRGVECVLSCGGLEVGPTKYRCWTVKFGQPTKIPLIDNSYMTGVSVFYRWRSIILDPGYKYKALSISQLTFRNPAIFFSNTCLLDKKSPVQVNIDEKLIYHHKKASSVYIVPCRRKISAY